MNSKTTSGNDILVKRTKRRCLLLLGFLLLFGWFGFRLATTESADDWKEADITIADVQNVSRRISLWNITDTDGNIYSAHGSQTVMDQILPNGTYHIVCSPNHDIRAITQGDFVIIDYAHSVSVYCERNIWDWLLAFLGLAGTITTIAYMVLDIRKKIMQG